MVGFHLLFVILALVCLGLHSLSVDTGKLNLFSAAGFCLVLAVLVFP